MKFIIFAGGSGRRLWPISRKHSPKQFEPLLGEKSTLQMAVERVEERYGLANIFISTNERYIDIIQEQLPSLRKKNIIGEPERRDLAPAVGLAMAHLAAVSDDPDEPVAILWGDNYMSDQKIFLDLLDAAQQLLAKKDARIVFIGETPRFANENLGWIGLGEQRGEVAGQPFYALDSFRYRPPLQLAQEMYESGRFTWNTGYFVTTIGFVHGLYRKYQLEMAEKLALIENAIGTEEYKEVLYRVYPQLEKASFDDAILVHITPEQAAVLHGTMGWSDPGTLYALKEALSTVEQENVTEGLVISQDSSDSLLVNQESGKLLAVIGLEGMIVVNTKEALLVVPKDRIPEVKQLVNSFEGTELEKYS